MDFVTAVRTCFNNYANFNGRARRAEYWWFTLFTVVASMALFALDMLIFGVPATAVVFMLAIIIPGLAVTIRRLHDTNHSGWWYLISLIPFGGLVLLYWLVIRGTEGTNDFGPDPIVMDASHVFA